MPRASSLSSRSCPCWSVRLPRRLVGCRAVSTDPLGSCWPPRGSPQVLVRRARGDTVIVVGVDWAEAHHDVHVADEAGKRLAKARLPEGVDGIARFHELVGAHATEPAE